jgi:hypothetical protein
MGKNQKQKFYHTGLTPFSGHTEKLNAMH